MKPKKNKLLFIASSAKLARRPALIRSLTAIPFATLILAASGLQAQTTYSFTDATGGTQLWTDGTNWNGGVAPTPVAGDTIQTNLTQAAATFLDLEADRTFANWSANFQGFGSRTFTISSGHTLTLAGTTPTVTVASGTLTMENILAGSAGLLKNGNNGLILNNASNSFSGGINLAAGTLRVASDGALGDAGNDITVSGNSTLQLANSMTIARNVALNSGTTLNFPDTNTSTISGAVTGDGGIYLNSGGFGTQSLTLSSTGNTFTGAIRVGIDATATLTVNSLADSASSLELFRSKGNATFVYGSGADSALVLNDRQVILSGNNGGSHVIENANADANNTVTIIKDLSITSTTNRKLVLGGINEGNNTIGGVIPDGVGGLTSLEKTGDGTWIVSGDNTYTGTTQVTAGTLIINGSTTSTSIVSVASGATLGGTGTVGGNTTVSGTLSPGNSPGTLSFGQDLTLNNGAFYALEAGDLTAVGQTLTLNDNWTLALGSGFQDGGQVLIFTYGTLAIGSDLDPTFDTLGLGFTPTGTLSLTDNGSGSIFLNGVSVIPEPSTALLGALGLLALLRRRRA